MSLFSGNFTLSPTLRPDIESKINHLWYFIKILYISKGIELIDLSGIFRDNSVVSSVPV